MYDFSEIIGNEQIIKSMKKAIENGKSANPRSID